MTFLRWQRNPQTPAANVVVALLTDTSMSLEDVKQAVEQGPPELWDAVTRTMVPRKDVLRALAAIVPPPLIPIGETLVVYHATDGETAKQLLQRGFIPETKPRRREGFDYAPGRGLDEGLYVGATPRSVDSYGRVILAIEIPTSWLHVPQELAQLGERDPLRALRSHDGAVIRTRIPAMLFMRVR